MKREALKCTGVRADDTSFGKLMDATFTLYQGETVALAGLFNSGKITLSRILSGDHTKYEGTIRVLGRPVKLDGYASVRAKKIACFSDIHRLFPNMSLYDNVHISQEGKHLFARMRYQHDMPEAMFLQEALGIDFSRKHIDALPSFDKTKLEILKAFIGGARIFFFSVMHMYASEQEAEQLAEILRLLNEMGVAIIIDYDDFFPLFEEVVHRCLVVRRGVVTTEILKDQNELFDEDHLRHAMVGRTFDRRYDPPKKAAEAAASPVLLEVRTGDGAHPLAARRGDIIGLYDPEEKLPKTVEGLLEAARHALQVSVEGESFRPGSIDDLVGRGIAVISKEISDKPIFFNLSPAENVSIFAQKLFGRKFLYQRHVSEYLYELVIRKHKILRHCAGLQARKDCYDLSYEQQYELMIAKWLAFNPSILLLYTPLSNVDAKNAERYKEWHRGLSREGKVQVLISSIYDSLDEVCTDIVTIAP